MPTAATDSLATAAPATAEDVRVDTASVDSLSVPPAAAATTTTTASPAPELPRALDVNTPNALDFAALQAGLKITESIAFLERIQQIEIEKTVKRGGRVSYVMEMYVQKPGADPSHPAKAVDPLVLHVNPLAGKQLEANYQVDRHFAEFAELRRMLQYISHLQGGKRHADKCPYCTQLLGFVEHSIWQPRFWVRLFTTRAMRQALLVKFMRKVVALAVSSKACERWLCEAYYHVPLLVEKFVRKPADASLGII